MTPRQRVVDTARWVIGVASATAVILLFTLDDEPEANIGLQGEIERMVEEGTTIYEAHCSSCHGTDGQGGTGPRLAGTVETLYPVTADQVAVVTDGRQAMRPFGEVLTEDQIAAVVLFTRLGLE